VVRQGVSPYETGTTQYKWDVEEKGAEGDMDCFWIDPLRDSWKKGTKCRGRVGRTLGSKTRDR